MMKKLDEYAQTSSICSDYFTLLCRCKYVYAFIYEVLNKKNIDNNFQKFYNIIIDLNIENIKCMWPYNFVIYQKDHHSEGHK